MKKQSPLGRGFGKGIDLLIQSDAPDAAGSASISEVPLDLIHPNPDQPRADFDTDALNDLAASIRAVGIIQPITLRQTEPCNYLIISGERRFRAAHLAGLTAIPAYVRPADQENIMEMALIENIQRQDLNPIEIALAYRTLIDQHGLTQEQLSLRVGKKRSTIANYLRLINLPAPIQLALKEANIDMGHARALLAIDNPQVQIDIFELILANHLSVREVEDLARHPEQFEPNDLIPTRPPRTASHYAPARELLSRFLDTKVRLAAKPDGTGHISIPFASTQDLQRIIDLITPHNP